MRAVAAHVVRTLLDESPGATAVVCIGPGERTRPHPVDAWGTLGGYGVAVDGPADHPATPATLPLALTVGRVLLDAAGWGGPLVPIEVDAGAESNACVALGSDLLRDHPDAAWLVLGDGSAARTPRAPRSLDPRAAGFDAQAARAFRDGDPDALLRLDPVLAAELGAAGRAAWQVLAGAALALGGSAANGASRDGHRLTGELLLDDAPFGVGYLVARWRPADPT